ncbi:hypothetical protein [Jannaschia sp. W003]|uniref:hypothetical protein n=1 Tax=Jannaschia sp. W003 TaxID=2867012 RepID=UPI0021A2A452|nr:hypothetical protein [Jannaschia sp. W003]UWQ23168.1 hypothetical protein K3554_16445 [Jannaschia sp. W003]
MTSAARQARAADRGATPWRVLRRAVLAILVACLALAVFAAALLATLPMSVLTPLAALPPQVEALEGRLAEGRARLSGGLVLDWRAEPAALLSGALAVRLVLVGPATRLDGRLRADPFGVALEGIEGRAGSEALALVPGAPQCSGVRAVVAVERLAWAWRGAASAGGGATVEPGTCTGPGGETLEVPAMRLAFGTEGPDATARLLREDDGAALAEARVGGDRRLALRLEPEGAALVPGLPRGGPMILELPF